MAKPLTRPATVIKDNHRPVVVKKSFFYVGGAARLRYNVPSGRSGGIGRRAGFRILWAQARGGSSPPFGIRSRRVAIRWRTVDSPLRWWHTFEQVQNPVAANPHIIRWRNDIAIRVPVAILPPERPKGRSYDSSIAETGRKAVNISAPDGVIARNTPYPCGVNLGQKKNRRHVLN